jgi:hypothetical protein
LVRAISEKRADTYGNHVATGLLLPELRVFAMKRHLSTWIGLAAVAAWVVAAPAVAQDRAGASPPSGGGAGASASAPSSGGGGGGSTTSSSGGGSGGGIDRAGAGSSFGGGNRGEAGGHGGATGGSGIAIPRGDYSSGRYGETSSGRSGATAGRNSDDGRDGVPEFSRPRDGAAQVGTAVPRPAGSTPSKGGTNYVVVPGGYYGGYGYPYGGGYGGYYGGYSGYYSGYYDPFYDPWYGAYYSSYSYPQSSSGFSYGTNDDGALRLKIKPRNAEVYVDGYYVGIVDEFDGMFQRLHIEPGAHRVEVRAAGYDTLVFEVKISQDHTTTYQGEMKKIQ